MRFPFKKIQLTLLIILLIVTIFFRFWKIRDYIVFLGDEGRDMIVMRKIFTEKHLPFLGPTASVGGFYLGPIYYWMAAPFLLLSRFDPVGPAYMVAIIGTATVFLLYKFIKDALGFWPAITTSFLYSTAPLIVRYSRSSWNPNPLPFFSLLLLYFLYLGLTKKSLKFFFLAGLPLGIVLQLHYLASILIAIVGLIVLIGLNYKKWPQAVVSLFSGFLITFAPFLVFEIRNNFPNFRTIMEFITRGSTLGFKSNSLEWIFPNISNIFLEELSRFQNTPATKIAFWILTFSGIITLVQYWKNKDAKLFTIIAMVYFLGGLAGLRFYAGQVFDYYFGFMFPAPFLLFALLIYLLWNKLILKITAIAQTGLLLAVFLQHPFYKTPPNRLIEQTSTIADLVVEKSQNKPFNFGLISDSNSDHAYRYMLEIKKATPTELEQQVTDQLLVVCESKTCAPLGHPIWEIAGFGRAEIAGEWYFQKYNIKVFRLTHWPGAPNPAGKPAIKGS